MEFTLIGEDKLKVTLTAADLATLGIDPSALDYSNEVTRAALLGLLERGRETAGFHPRRAKLYIEVYPNDSGGCVIYYTRLAGGELSRRGFTPGPAPVSFAFGDIHVLLRACAGVYARCGHRILRSALYRLGGEYRLLIWPLDYADNLSVSFLSEYGALLGEGTVLAAFLDEHAELLIDGDAVERLSKLI